MRTPRLHRRDVLRGAVVAAAGVGTGAGRSALGAPSPMETLVERSRLLAKNSPSARGIRVLIPEGSEANVRPIAERFEAATGVRVSILTTPVDDVATTMTVRTLAGKSGFDVALPPTFAIPDLVENGIVQPLDGMEAMALAQPKTPGGRSLFSLGDRYKGSTYGFQTDGDVYLMFYNRGLLEDPEIQARFGDTFERKLDVPRTWEELDAAMSWVHDPEAGRFGGTLFRTPSYLAWEFWIRLHAKGVFPVDPSMRPLIDGAEGIAAAEELVAASKWQSPGAATNGLFDNWRDFEAGAAFCNIGWGGSQKHFNRPDSKIRNGLVFGPTPGGVLGGQLQDVSYFNWGWNYSVSTLARHGEQALIFSLFAIGDEPSLAAVRAQDGFFDPFQEHHYDDEEVEAAYTRPFLDQHRQCMRRAIPDFYVEGRVEYFDLLSRFLARANAGKMTVKAALEVVAKGWEGITDRKGRASQIQQWEFLRGRYPEHLVKHLRTEAG